MDVRLLYKKVEGTLTDQETRRFDAWLNESADHREYFKRFSQRYQGEDIARLSTDDLQTYRLEFVERLSNAQRKARKLKRRKLSLYAASVAAMLALAMLLVVQLNQEPKESFAAIEEESFENIVIPEGVPEEIYKPKVSNKLVTLKTSKGQTYDLKNLDSIPLLGLKFDASNSILAYSQQDNQATIEENELNELSVGRGADFTLTLSDGTRVWLNADTKIKYPNQFSGKERRVWLSGEAYFEVAKDKEAPFYVTTDKMDVRVYGTEFNINTRYRGITATTLVEGSVAVIPENQESEVLLTPGRTAEFNPLTSDMNINDRDIALYIGWRKGVYMFEDISLQHLTDELMHWYEVDFIFLDEDLKEEYFSGVFSRKASLHSILTILEKTNYITYEIKHNTVEVKKKAFN